MTELEYQKRIAELESRERELEIRAREEAILIRELSWGGRAFMYCPMPPMRPIGIYNPFEVTC